MSTQKEHPELRSGGAEGGEHQSVMKKVKAKARKIKDSITKHGHGHHGHEAQPHHDIHPHHGEDQEDSDDDVEDDAELHGAPIYESKEVRSHAPDQGAASIQHDAMAAGRSHAPGDGAASIQHDAMAAGRSHAPGGGAASIQHDVMAAGRSHPPGGGAASIQHDVMAAGRSHAPGGGAASIQHDVMAAGRSHAPSGGAASIQHDVMAAGQSHAPGGGAASIQHDVVAAVARPTPSADVGHHGTAPSIQHPHSHGTAPHVQRDVVQAGGHVTPAAPSAIGHHGATLPGSNIGSVGHQGHSNFGLSSEAHNIEEHRNFSPDQVGVSKHDGVTFGGGQTHHDAGGGLRPTHPTGHSLASKPNHPQTNTHTTLGTGGVYPQATGVLDRDSDLVRDPHSPTADRKPHNYQSKTIDPTGRGSDEIGITPILHSLDKMTPYDDGIKQTSTGQQGSFMGPNAGSTDKNRSQPQYGGPVSHEQPSPGSNVSSAANVVSDKAVQAKNAVASKLGYGEGDHQKTNPPAHSYDGGFEPDKTSSPSKLGYGEAPTHHSYDRGFEPEKTSSPSTVTDYGKKVASTVYEKVAGAGGAVMGKMPGAHEAEHEPVHDKGISTKEYVVEKVSPGEEDKALSEVISEALEKPRVNEEEDLKDDKQAEPKGKVTFSANVVRQLGGDEEAHQSVEDLGTGVSGPLGGGAVVGSIRDTVASWLGFKGETEEPSSLVWHDIPKDANEGDQQDKRDKGLGT